MGRSSKLNVLFRWYSFVSTRSDIVLLANKIDYKLKKETDEEIVWSLKTFLAKLMASRGLFSESEKIYINMNRIRPFDPRPLILLSQQYLYYENDPQKALTANDGAIKIAFETGNFRREALTVNIRIALDLKRFDLVERDMKRIMSEDDFIKRIPVGMVSGEILKDYVEFCKSVLPPR